VGEGEREGEDVEVGTVSDRAERAGVREARERGTEREAGEAASAVLREREREGEVAPRSAMREREREMRRARMENSSRDR
jgi:hypothetical protein